MTEEPQNDQMPEGDPEEMRKSWEAVQSAQRAYIAQAFRWLAEFVAAYFPEDKLEVEDLMTEVQFYHSVTEGGKVLGVLVYRFRKFLDKGPYYTEMASEIREQLGVPEVLFVDSETSRFEAPASCAVEGPFLEIPPDALTGKIRELREEMKKRGQLRSLKDSL